MLMLQGLLFLFFGGGFLFVARNGLRDGELPAGAKGFSSYRPSRARSPGAFWFHFLLYVALGCALVVYGALSLAGAAEPLPLRPDA